VQVPPTTVVVPGGSHSVVPRQGCIPHTSEVDCTRSAARLDGREVYPGGIGDPCIRRGGVIGNVPDVGAACLSVWVARAYGAGVVLPGIGCGSLRCGDSAERENQLADVNVFIGLSPSK
jgi:hypothetical protein